MHRRVFILGSTGSIGKNTIDVLRDFRAQRTRGVRQLPPEFEVVGVSAHRNAEEVARQAHEFHCSAVAVAEPDGALEVPADCKTFRGPSAPCEMLQAFARRGDLVVVAIVGAAGIQPTLTALRMGCDLALANKETLVAAGSIVMPEADRHGARIIPIDSEHNALFQCLKSATRFERGFADVRRVVLTASGGPFRTSSAEELERVTVAEALRHPTWTMGPKVTIDSASLMNKALELIEAHWLFGLPSERLDAIVHPQSMVHGFVEFLDGSTLAQLAPPDMRTPIQHALTDPQRFEGPSRKIDWQTMRSLEFEPVDHKRFPALTLAHAVIARGGLAGAIFNAANEVAVQAFLERRVGFCDITRIVGATLERFAPQKSAEGITHSLDAVLDADAQARAFARQTMGSIKAPPFSRSAASSTSLA